MSIENIQHNTSIDSELLQTLFHNVADYLHRHYVDVRAFSYTQSARCCSPSVSQPAPTGTTVCEEAASMSLEELLVQEDAGFAETLLKLIDQTGKKDSEIYKKANLSKQHFSKIRNNPRYQPTKATAIALALALELDLEATRDLIGRAGFALTNSSKFDLIIRYFIEHRNYNLVEINLVLYQFDQPLLGASI